MEVRIGVAHSVQNTFGVNIKFRVFQILDFLFCSLSYHDDHKYIVKGIFTFYYLFEKF